MGRQGGKQPSSPRTRRPRTKAPRRLGDGTGYGEGPPLGTPTKTRPYMFHDRVNLVCLAVLSALCLGGLADWLDCWQVTVIFTGYIVLDLLWILIVPESLPRHPQIITVHHLVTLALLSHPLLVPQDARFTCLDGLVELSTFFMIARRHCAGRLSALCNALYWVSTVGLRFVLQPYLLYKFHLHTLNYESRTRATVLVRAAHPLPPECARGSRRPGVPNLPLPLQLWPRRHRGERCALPETRHSP
jgi:hypothetical protein